MNVTEHVYVKTPLGPVGLQYRTAPFRLLAVSLRKSSEGPLGQGAASAAGFDELLEVLGLISGYFNRRPVDAPWRLLSMGHLTPLQQKVLYETARIPWGALKTYKWVAGAIGRPRACRFVGTALGKNPFPILIPCHRVVRNDGRIGGFGAGPDVKQWLIDFESTG
ncbi:MAG: methylated-DNA--[protein]-cysteine S-methyltransferase [Desulfobacterales bacterium]|nr:methylated-DNA--[protein]-cysteine S-methyltransferase [Desulfobacterales bacterium]